MLKYPQTLLFRRLVERVGVVCELYDDSLGLFFPHVGFIVLRLRLRWLLLIVFPALILLFFLLVPLFAVLESVYFKLLPQPFVLFCMFVSAFSISLFPLVFLDDSFRKNLGLLVFVCLLIQWDWIVTWYYVFQNSSAELNFLINVSNFGIFTLQKISPLLLFGLLFFIARNEDKLMRILDVSLVVIAVSYYLLFVWHLYVVSVVSMSMYYMLLISLFTGSFSVTGLLRGAYFSMHHTRSLS